MRSCSYHRTIILSLFLLPVCLMSAPPARASTPEKYLKFRQTHRCQTGISYTTLQEDPSSHIGKVFELSGKVSGTVGGESNIMVLLELPDKNTVELEFPRSEQATLQEVSPANLRVVVRVKRGASGNVVPMEVLCAASDSAIRSIESQLNWQKQQAENARRARLRAQQSQRSSRSGSRFPRSLPLTAEMQTVNAFYQPYLGPRTKSLFLPYLQFICSQNRRLSIAQAGQITAGLLHFSDQCNVDPRLVVAMIIAESNFNPNSTSRTGAKGLGQLMPGTARSLGVSNAYDPIENLRGSIEYLRGRLNHFQDKALPDGGLSFEQVALAMAAYNAGLGAVKKYKGIPPYRETQAYVRRITSLYQQLCSGN